MPDYQPKAEDVAYVRNVIALLKDGGRWGLPAAGDTYQLDRGGRRLVLIAGKGGSYDKTKAVLAALGWGIADERPKGNV